MDLLAKVLAITVSTIVIIGAVIAVVAFVRGSYVKARMQALREDNDDLRARVDDQDKELARCRAREDTLEVKVTALESEKALLESMVTQRAEVNDLIKAQERYHKEIMTVLEALVTAINRIG